MNPKLDEVKDRIADMTSKAKDKAAQMTDVVAEKLDQQRENTASGLGKVASTMHQNANSVPGGPKAADLTHNIANGMEATASYLRDHDFSQMGKDLMDVCRRYPTQSLVAALAFGFLVGRSARR